MRLLFATTTILFALAAVMNVVAAMTRRSRRRLEELERLQESEPPRFEPVASPAPIASATTNSVSETAPAANAEREAPHRRVFSADGFRGLCFVPVLAMFLVANTRLMAEAFEILLDHPGNPLGQFTPFGLNLAITDLHLYGLALSAALMLAGGAYAAQCETRSPVRWFTLLLVLVPLVAFEAGTSYLRGLILAAENANPDISPTALALQNGVQGFFCATVETISGFYVIESFLIPCLQLLVWAIAVPLRAVRRRLDARRAARQRKEQERDARPRVVQVRARVGFFHRVAAYLDEAWFEPLRRLDRAVAARARAFFNRSTEVIHD
jgi:hypothetical protein